MKKVLFLLLATGMLIQPCFADIKQEIKSIDVKSENLSKQYDGYEVTLTNTGKNPVKIVNIECSNAANMVEGFMGSFSYNSDKKDRKLLYLSPFTFGITGLVYYNKTTERLEQQKADMAEASKFNTQINTLASTMQVLVPEMHKSFKVLVPKGSTPDIQAVFQDIKTNEYIKAK